MVKQDNDRLGAVFQALSDGTRRSILERVGAQELTISEIARPYGMSLAAVSRHISVLEEAGLLLRRREGRTFRCRLNYVPLEDVDAVLQRYRRLWENRFDALERYLAEQERTDDETPST